MQSDCVVVLFICLGYSALIRYSYYGQGSKILNTFLFLFSSKLLVIKAGIYKMLIRIATREDYDQTASSEAV